MPNLNYLKEFLTICETRSFTQAAQRLGISRSVLSEHMTELERQAGMQLLKRTTRQVMPTLAGEELRRVSHNAFDQVQQTLLDLQQEQGELRGPIRLTCAVDFSVYLLGPLIAQFHQIYPEVNFDVLATDESVDLITHNLDLSIRTGWLTDSSYHATRIGHFHQILLASPDRLSGLDSIHSPLDLVRFPWLTLTVLKKRLWTFRHVDGREESVRLEGAFRANAASVIHLWVRQGIGMTVLPDYQVNDEISRGELLHLLPGWQLPEGGIYAVYPDAAYLPYRVRVFIDFLKMRLDGSQAE